MKKYDDNYCAVLNAIHLLNNYWFELYDIDNDRCNDIDETVTQLKKLVSEAEEA